MKYGLIYYNNTKNIGDDILSYAGKQFLPQVDYYINRESLDVFIPNKKEYVTTIVNGWYLHHNYTFQPSPYLNPLFIGTHFSKDEMLFNDYSWIDESVVKYLQAHEPIGCRDKHSAELLSEKHINTYFSGCMTLTLQKFPNVSPNHSTILVDVSDNIANYITETLPNNQIIRKTHRLSPEEVGLDWEVREERLINLLKLYQGADLVVTSRLHCALPCLALGTPVLFIGTYNEDFHIRIESFKEFLPCFSEKEILSHNADYFLLHPTLKNGIEKLATPLIKTCQDFIANSKTCEDTSLLPDLTLYREMYIERTQYMRFAIESLTQIRIALSKQVQQDAEEMKKIISLCEKVLSENDALKQELLSLKNN